MSSRYAANLLAGQNSINTMQNKSVFWACHKHLQDRLMTLKLLLNEVFENLSHPYFYNWTQRNYLASLNMLYGLELSLKGFSCSLRLLWGIAITFANISSRSVNGVFTYNEKKNLVMLVNYNSIKTQSTCRQIYNFVDV